MKTGNEFNWKEYYSKKSLTFLMEQVAASHKFQQKVFYDYFESKLPFDAASNLLVTSQNRINLILEVMIEKFEGMKQNGEEEVNSAS